MKLLSIIVLLTAATASAGFGAIVIAYDAPVNTGNQGFSGSLGMDFTVNSAITIDSFGVFDNDTDGLSSTLSVAIFNLAGIQQGSTVDFTPGAPGTLVNGSRFITLGSNLVLAPGDYSIVAWGFNGTDRHGNFGELGGVLSTLNTNGGLISFVGTSRYDLTAGVFPGTPDGGPANRYLAGTFTFDAEGGGPVIPEPGTYALVGLGLAGLAYYRRRKLAG